MPHPQYTPQFEQYCKRYFTKYIPFGLDNSLADFTPANVDKLLEDLERCDQLQLQYIKGFTKKAKAEFETAKANCRNLTEEQKLAYSKFFADLEEKIKKCTKVASKKASAAPNQGQQSHSSYKPSAQSGQSFYDSMMHILGYDATTVGASAIFFLAFSALRFIVGSPYWEQVAEYHYNPSRQFKPDALTEEQEALNLHKNSTREEILQAGFLPPPDRASAYSIELENFMSKIGKIAKDSHHLNPLGANLVHPPRR